MSPKSLNPVCFLPPFVSGLRSLTTLHLSGRNLSEDGFPVDFGNLSSLQFLDLSRNNFRNLPDCIGRLPKLYNLHLHECTDLQSISGVFASVGLLDTSDSTSMEKLSISSNHKRGLLFDLRNCHKLTEIQGLENWEFDSIHSEGCNNLPYDFRNHYHVISLSLSLILCSEHFFFLNSVRQPWAMMSLVSFASLVVRFQVGSAIRELGVRYLSVYLQFQRVNSFGCLFVLFMQPT
jgi:hypothetical protein